MLVSSVLNKALKEDGRLSEKVSLPLSKVVSDLKQLLHKYAMKFSVQTNTIVDEEVLVQSIQQSSLAEFVTTDDNTLTILKAKYNGDKFKRVIVTSLLNYSTTLIKQIYDLGRLKEFKKELDGSQHSVSGKAELTSEKNHTNERTEDETTKTDEPNQTDKPIQTDKPNQTDQTEPKRTESNQTNTADDVQNVDNTESAAPAEKASENASENVPKNDSVNADNETTGNTTESDSDKMEVDGSNATRETENPESIANKDEPASQSDKILESKKDEEEDKIETNGQDVKENNEGLEEVLNGLEEVLKLQEQVLDVLAALEALEALEKPMLNDIPKETPTESSNDDKEIDTRDEDVEMQDAEDPKNASENDKQVPTMKDDLGDINDKLETEPAVATLPLASVEFPKNIDVPVLEPVESPSAETKEETPEMSDIEAQATPRSRKRLRSPAASQHKRFQNIAINLIQSILAHRFSLPFLQAVTKKDAPDYYDVIYEPKDLKNILKQIKLKADPPKYSLVKELERDIMLMFANCIMYNKLDEDLVQLTISMKNDVKNMFVIFEEAEMEMK